MNDRQDNETTSCNDSPAEDLSFDRQSSEEVNECLPSGDGALEDPLFTNINTESKLRRRKGKIITCAKETIQSASRQLRRRVPYAGHLMTPRRLWLTKIPTQCDVVIEFPENAPDEALRWLLARIRSPPPSGLELVVQVKAHESTKSNAFYISAPMNILFKAAEEARLPKRLRPELGAALREFTTRESHCFQQIQQSDGSLTLFTSQERQWLVLQVLQGLRAGQNDIEALHGRATVEEGQSIVAAWLETGLISQIFPLHEVNALTKLQANWVKKVFSAQPLDDIAEYFGVKVALYFAWLGHYTCALTVPAVFGTIIYVLLWGRGQTAQDIGHVLFSLFNVAWASLYLEAWKRYSIELAFRWGTLSTPPELLEPPRPLYKGTLVENNVTGRLEPREAPAWKRRAFRYFVSFPIIGFCLFLVFIVMFAMLRFQDWLDERNIGERGYAQCIYNLHKDWWDSRLPEDSIISCFSVIPKVLLAGAITLMDEAYYKLAVWLNDRENYRLQSKYENHLIAKVALFQFVNSFLSLFYIAFYLRDEDKLKEQLAGLLISRQIIGNLRESAVPYIIEQWKLAKLSFKMWGALSPSQNANRTMIDSLPAASGEASAPDASKEASGSPKNGSSSANRDFKRNIGQAEIESAFYKYDGTFSDHLEMLVQIGYVVLFSAAFPLAGICALLNNMMEIRSDAFKLAHVHQRPFGQRVANIGTWQNALTLLSLAAVIVNCALIGLSGQVSRLWPGLTTTQTIVLIVTMEHIMLGLRSALTWILPELPSWLAAEIARAEHCRREMQCKGTSPRQTPPSSTEMNADSVPADLNRAGISNEYLTGSQFNLDDSTPKDLDLEAANTKCMHFEDHGEAAESSTPDSPPSQTSSILIRPLHEMEATKNIFNPDLSNNSPGNQSVMSGRQIHIQEIPPFRKKSTDSADHTGSSASTSPQHIRMSKPVPIPQLQSASIPEIPPFRTRKISEEFPAPTSDKFSLKPHVPEWMARLKVNDNVNLRRSIDCIAKELTSNIDSGEILKPAPSWSNIATKTPAPQFPSTSSGSASNITGTVTKKLNEGMKGSTPKTSSSWTLNQQHPTESAEQTQKSPIPTILATQHENVDAEKEAAELAAKKSRLKQKLVKKARSVGIFSLKLKERRQREAEKAATMAIEHAKALAKLPQPGGELSLIPIEQLIQIDDIKPNQKLSGISGSVTASGSSSSSQPSHYATSHHNPNTSNQL